MIHRKKVITNLIWRFFERIGAQGVTLVVSLVLAQFLDPEDYGTVAIVTVFTSVMQVFIDGGLGNALIQKKDADEVDFSSVFYFNLFMCVVLYLLMFFAAPIIAWFYEMPELTALIRVISIALLISGIKNIQVSYVSRNMQFKKFFYATLGGTIGAAAIGITMAFYGYGVWALVAQYLFNMTVDTIILWIAIKWRPQKIFSWSRLMSLFSYGWKILVSNLLNTVERELRQLIIGKHYSKADLAFYNRGEQFPKLFVVNINTSIDSVLLPALSVEQDDSSKVKNMTRRAIKTSTYIMMPLMVGLAVCAEPMIRLILPEKWLPAVFYLRIFCFTYAFYPIHTANLNAIKALGRSELFLKLEIIKKIIGFIALISTVFISVKVMALSLLAVSVISQIINSWPNRKLLKYSYFEQLRDIIPQILISILMGGIVYSITFLGLNDIVTLIIQIPLGILLYIMLSLFFHIDSFEYVLSTIRSLFGIRS